MAAPDGLTIMNLNDDCLGMICSRLTKWDQISFAHVNERFREIFELHCRSQHMKIKIFKDFNGILEFRDYLEVAGNYVETINICKLNSLNMEELFIAVAKYCLNVRKIRFAKLDILTASAFEKLVSNAKNLKDIKCSSCNIDDDLMLALSELPSLEVLSIQFTHCFNAKYLHKLVKLKRLNLLCCKSIAFSELHEVAISLKSLEVLNLKSIGGFTANILAEFGKNCRNIHTLCISSHVFQNNMENECIIEMPNIANLYLEIRTLIFPDQFFEYIADKLICVNLYCVCRLIIKYMEALLTFKNLEKITLINCDISDEYLLRLLQCCKKLVQINLKSCRNISYNFVPLATAFLTSHSNHKVPVIFNWCKLGFDKWVKDNQAIANNSVLKICNYIIKSGL